jgi:hypothetical protein
VQVYPPEPALVRPDAKPPSAVGKASAGAALSYAVPLRWAPARDDTVVASYEVYRGGSAGFEATTGRLVGEAAGDRPAWTDPSPPAGRTAWYAVRAVDAVGRAGAATYVKVAVPPNAPPANRLALRAAPDARAARLSWTGEAAGDVVGVEVLRGVGSGELKAVATVDSVDARGYVDSGLAPGRTYRYALRLVDSGSLRSPVGKAVAVRPLLFLKRINCGGRRFVGPDGLTWSGDGGARGGSSVYTFARAAVKNAGALEGIYRSERWAHGRITYRLAVPPGDYRVVLHFAELHPAFSGKGRRTFDVYVNGRAVAEGVDVFDAAGGAGVAWQLVATVSVAAGAARGDAPTAALVVELRGAPTGPAIKGIEVYGYPPGAASRPAETKGPAQ